MQALMKQETKLGNNQKGNLIFNYNSCYNERRFTQA